MITMIELVEFVLEHAGEIKSYEITGRSMDVEFLTITLTNGETYEFVGC